MQLIFQASIDWNHVYCTAEIMPVYQLLIMITNDNSIWENMNNRLCIYVGPTLRTHSTGSTLFKSANTDLIKNHLSSKNLETSFNTCPSLQQHSMSTCSIIIIYEVIRESPPLSLTMSGFKLLCVIGPDRDPVDRALILKSTDTHLLSCDYRTSPLIKTNANSIYGTLLIIEPLTVYMSCI